LKNVSRTVALVAATALSAAGLVGTATTSATAAAKAPVATSYTCSVPGFFDFALPLSISTSLPATAKTGKAVPAKNVSYELTVPATVVATAAAYLSATALGGELAGDATAGKTKIGMTGTFAPVTIANPPGDLVLTGTGKTATFKAGKPGTYVVKAPKALAFTPTNQDGTSLLGALTCTLTPGAATKLATIKVTK